MILPMYYQYPREQEAYHVPNQYLFGSEMMVAAVTTPCIKALDMAKTAVWIPEGEWCDIFTGMRYRGGRKMNLYRDITSIPVLAKAGAIIPFQDQYMENADENPGQLHLYVYTGADGRFILYEDDNTTTAYQEGKCVRTTYLWQEDEGSLRICHAEGDTSLIPEKRDYIITFCGIKDAQITGHVLSDGRKIGITTEENADVTVLLENMPVGEDILVNLQNRVYRDNEVVERCYKLLERALIEYNLKETIFNLIRSQSDPARLLGELLVLGLDQDLCNALAEIITSLL